MIRAGAEASALEGYRSAKAVTRHHAKSFFFASHLLRGTRRKAAFALYAFCRRLDDLVDLAEGSQREHQLNLVRRRLPELFVASPPTLDWGPPFVEEELLALSDSIRRFALPSQPFSDLISGLEMDLTADRYRTVEELDLYCYRVAGTVGLLLAPVLGHRDPRALAAAADLGKAMQLTNILRDVREDLERGRLYLPQDELERFGVSEANLRAGLADEPWRALARWQIARARGLYASAEAGVPLLLRLTSRLTVRLMARIYGDILRQIEVRGYDVFAGRAGVSRARKLWLTLRILLGAQPTLPALTAGERRREA